jgi:uncharacterized repeat protein (TIGR04052 family)
MRIADVFACFFAISLMMGLNVVGPARADEPINITFAVTDGGKPAGCGAHLMDLGFGHVGASLQDARLYVYAVKLIDADGKRVPVTLTRNNWQFADIALLDFKDVRGGHSACSASNPAKNVSVAGTAAAAHYVGLEFSVGVPVQGEVDGGKVSLNHSSVETAPPPLDVSDMNWSWQAGRKFVKIEVEPDNGITKSDGGPAKTWFVHLGSTGCTGNPATGEIVSCTHPNRFTVTFDHFDPGKQQVELDLAALFRNSELSIDKGGTIGCMSGVSDPECHNIFEQFGLNLVDTTQGARDAGQQYRLGFSPIFSVGSKP